MKARVKAIGHIVDVQLSHYIGDVAWYITKCHASYPENELEFIGTPEDYWTRLEHQYAGMAMQGMLSNTSLMSMLFDATKDHDELLKEVIICSHEYAHALVEKLKETK